MAHRIIQICKVSAKPELVPVCKALCEMLDLDKTEVFTHFTPLPRFQRATHTTSIFLVLHGRGNERAPEIVSALKAMSYARAGLPSPGGSGGGDAVQLLELQCYTTDEPEKVPASLERAIDLVRAACAHTRRAKAATHTSPKKATTVSPATSFVDAVLHGPAAPLVAAVASPPAPPVPEPSPVLLPHAVYHEYALPPTDLVFTIGGAPAIELVDQGTRIVYYLQQEAYGPLACLLSKAVQQGPPATAGISRGLSIPLDLKRTVVAARTAWATTAAVPPVSVAGQLAVAVKIIDQDAGFVRQYWLDAKALRFAFYYTQAAVALDDLL